MNEIQLNNITFTPGEVKVSDELANQIIANAESVAEQIDSVEVDETNIKQIKKMLAEAKKIQKKLNDKKIEVKKAYMTPYTKLETLIKEAQDIIELADKNLREKTKNIDNQAKREKFEEIQEVFDLEVENYNLKGLITFEDWFKKEFLNKTYTMKKVNENLNLFLMRIWNDLQIAKTLENPELVIYKYLKMENASIYEAQIIAESEYQKVTEIKKWLNEN